MTAKWFSARGEAYPIPIGALAICLLCHKPFARVTKEVNGTDLASDGYKHLIYLNGREVLPSHPYFVHPKCDRIAHAR